MPVGGEILHVQGVENRQDIDVTILPRLPAAMTALKADEEQSRAEVFLEADNSLVHPWCYIYHHIPYVMDGPRTSTFFKKKSVPREFFASRNPS
ncbi:hypothetical protein CKA38_00800 [Ereboglobus luteus]|uniref:Uncharacterized protein n=1 Tax=Ereboglobus luteus TaxID=1796921 RepID=A0A2U8E086_9BACT|nr:hypothetical protein CKA38_00800 [Ereboglobus luteus]